MSTPSTWYGSAKSTAKQLEQLIETKPLLIQLFNTTDFLSELKSYNTKLLDYFSKTPELTKQAIDLITVAPRPQDSKDRSYKHPLQAIEMIEADITCVMNSFFRQVPAKSVDWVHQACISNGSLNKNSENTLLMANLFKILSSSNAGSSDVSKSQSSQQILPILGGYFYRACLAIMNNRFKETVDFVYSDCIGAVLFDRLLEHSYLMPVAGVMQMYLNLDVNKSSQSEPQRLELKKSVLWKIIRRIAHELKFNKSSERAAVVIENLMTILVETIEKYYLILDGKAMMDIITSEECVQTMYRIVESEWQGSWSGFNFFISLINYYSFSSFNSDDPSEDPGNAAKNLERLESQPLMVVLNGQFPQMLEAIMSVHKPLNLFKYRQLEVLCHCVSISSQQLFKSIKQTGFFGKLVELLFRHPQNNILHTLIEKSFLHVFISERRIYSEYKYHLFCELDIIDLTVNRVLKQYEGQESADVFEQLRRKNYFGHFMGILKIYSGIQTTDDRIISSIKAKTEVWNKVSSGLIKPFESICGKELGKYVGLPEGNYQEFKVTKTKDSINLQNPPKKPMTTSFIEEIRKEEQTAPIKAAVMPENKLNFQPTLNAELLNEQKKEEEILKQPPQNFHLDFKSSPPKEIKKAESFKDFMSKKKVEAEKQIKLKRSLSNEKRLSGSKGKMSNFSPKKNSWTQKNKPTQPNLSSKSESVHTTTKSASQAPKIPHSANRSNNLTLNDNRDRIHGNSTISAERSSVSQHSAVGSSVKSQSLSVRSQDFEKVKHIKVIQIQTPTEKKYRRIEEKDKVLLEFLGIKTALTSVR